ncbi:hypothetical protein [uncultured Enterovirga sp.]|uniref:hypothetical protein n=1 Tax=uncultured Enterovirga sp. TaxID=2026352 RepID=UPI0035CC906C
MMAVPGHAQEITPDPQAWRPLAYADLQRPSDATRTYADIWRDAIEENNRVYLSRGDTRFRDGNAPVTEAHFVIWSPRKSVVVTILNTATGCTLKEVGASARATVKLCPMRLAIYEGVMVRTMDGGPACFLELVTPITGSTSEQSRAAAYGSYDPAAKVVKIGLVVEGRAVDGCSLNVPLSPP